VVALAFADVALVPALAAAGAKERCIGTRGVAVSDLVGAVGKQLATQAGRDLDMPDTGRYLAVGDPQSPLGSVEAKRSGEAGNPFLGLGTEPNFGERADGSLFVWGSAYRRTPKRIPETNSPRDVREW
jgi:hypothetical protein